MKPIAYAAVVVTLVLFPRAASAEDHSSSLTSVADSLLSKHAALPKDQQRKFLQDLTADEMNQFIHETVKEMAKDATPDTLLERWEECALLTGDRFEDWAEKLLVEQRRLTRGRILELLGDPNQDFAWRVAFHGYLRVILQGREARDAHEIGLADDEISKLQEDIQTLRIEPPESGLGAEQPQDGIYLRAEGEPAPVIVSEDGRRIFLGAGRNLKIEKGEFFSQDNANTRFSLSLTVPYDKSIGPSSYVLLVDGNAYPQSGSGSSGEESSSLHFLIQGEDAAKQVSKYLATPLNYRAHPRHTLQVSFRPARREYFLGDEVAATLRIQNAGTNTVAFMKGGRNRAARDNQYMFSAQLQGKQVKDIGSSDHFGGLAVRRVLKPGEAFEDTISLGKWFAFDSPGWYEIHGSYYLNFVDPLSDSWTTIWEDYVAADFTVSVKEPEKTSKQAPEAIGTDVAPQPQR